MTTAIPTTSVEELRLRLSGALFEPGDDGYADTCTLFNAMIEKHPALVARCSAPDDVIAALAFARENGLEVTVRSGGHSVAGACLNDGGLVLDVRGMHDVEVDPERRVARVGGGATWSQVDAATQRYGLATTGGRVSSTGVAGLTLGGGSGWLERKHGLTVDNVLAVELVTADGRVVRASADQEPDLFWALRGGGGNFGVVTAFEFALHPVGPEVFAGIVVHPAEFGGELLQAYRDLMVEAPDELSLAFVYMVCPDEDPFPAELRGKTMSAVAGMWAGDPADGERATASIRALGGTDLFGVMPYAEFQCMLDDPPGYRNWWTSEYLPDLTPEAIATLHARTPQLREAAQIFIVAWGGAVPRHTDTPLSGRDAGFIVHPLFLWEDPADDEALIALGRAYRDDMKPFSTGATYLNFNGDEGADRVRAGFGDAYERLAAVKATWDPDNVFRGNQNIAPSPGRRA